MCPEKVTHIWKEYYNDFTGECDTHLIQRMKEFYEYGQKTYILIDNIGLKEKALAIRCPGATVGHIRYDDSSGKKIITEVEIYNDTLKMFYNESIKDIVTSKKYIGKELILEEERY